MNYTKGQITEMAKKICKVNDALHTAIGWCEELSHDDEISELLNNKENYQDEYRLLVERIIKFTKRFDGADGRSFESDIDDATDLLTIAYEDINI